MKILELLGYDVTPILAAIAKLDKSVQECSIQSELAASGSASAVTHSVLASTNSAKANANVLEVAHALTRLANACESLERALTDRMDIIEGRLDEMKPKGPEPVSTSVPGHRPWTQRQQERWNKNFNVAEFVTKLQKAGTDG